MKKIVIVTFALLFSGIAWSQSFYSLNYTMSFATGETGDYIESASFRGFSIDGRGFVSDQVSLGGMFNWSAFYEELAGATYTQDNITLTGTQYRYLNAFPMLFQAHYYLGTDSYEPRAFFGGGAGAYKMVQRTNVGVLSLEYNNWHFGLSPEVGMVYPVSFGTYLFLGLRYHYVFKAENTIDHSWFGLNIGFAWGD